MIEGNKVTFDLHTALCTCDSKYLELTRWGFYKDKVYRFFSLPSLDNEISYGVLNDENLLQVFSRSNFIEYFLPNEYNINIDKNTLVITNINEDKIIENKYR